MVLNAAFILGTLLLMLYLISQAGDLGAMIQAFQAVKPLWMLGALGCFSMHVLLEGIAVHRFFRYQGVKISLGSCELVGLIGIVAATINVVAGFGVTDRMLHMFKEGKEAEGKGQ